MPKQNLGKWSIGLILAMFILFVIGFTLANTLYESIPAGGTIFKDIISRPVLALSMLAGIAAGITAFVTGLIAILKQKERAFLVYVSTLIGAAFTLYIIAELLPF
jgi:hypothetical protein